MNIFRNREDTIMLCTVFSIPALMMGGVSYPIVAFPLWIKILGFFFPSTIGVKGFLALSQAGAGLNEVKDIYLQMWGLCIFYFILALWTNRRFLYKENPTPLLALPEGDSAPLLLAEHNDNPNLEENTIVPPSDPVTTAAENTTAENQKIEHNNTFMTSSTEPKGTILTLLQPLQDFVQGYHKLEDILQSELTSKTKHVASDKLQAPPTYIAVPALRALRYTTDTPELKDLYLNLLAASMDMDTVASIHPSFVDTIKHLTPDEVRLLTVFNDVEYVPYINILQVTDKEANIFHKVLENHVHVVEDSNISISFVGNLSLYFENLMRLGILTTSPTSSLALSAYTQLETCCLTRNIKKEIESKACSYEIERRYFTTTAYGKGFINSLINTANA